MITFIWNLILVMFGTQNTIFETKIVSMIPFLSPLGFQWNLFLVIVLTKFRFDNSMTRSTYGKKTETPNLHISTIFAFLRNWEGSLFPRKLWISNENTVLSHRILYRTTNLNTFPLFNVISILGFNDYSP